MEWDGRVHVEGTLPFGLRSVLLLFTTLGDAVQCVSSRQEWSGWTTILAILSLYDGECGKNLGVLKDMCAEWGLPLDDWKEEGPAAVFTLLG